MYHKKKSRLPKIIAIKVIEKFTLSNKVKEDRKLKDEIVEHEYRDIEGLLDVILTYSNPTVYTLKVGDLKKDKELHKYWRTPIRIR